MSSTIEQQYTNGRGKDGVVLPDNTNNISMPHTPPTELKSRNLEGSGRRPTSIARQGILTDLD
jgi:hypothetical protein